MKPKQYLGLLLAVFIGACIFAYVGSYKGAIAFYQSTAKADSNCGNGGPCGAQLASSLGTGDLGGGICSVGSLYSLCNPIAETITDSNATPLSFTNTTGTTQIANSNTNATGVQCSATGTNNCYNVAAPASGTGAALQVAGHFTANATCSGATPVVCAVGWGTVTSSASSATVTFTPNWKNAPICFARDVTTTTNTTSITVNSISTLTVTNSGAADADVIAFMCMGVGGG